MLIYSKVLPTEFNGISLLNRYEDNIIKASLPSNHDNPFANIFKVFGYKFH